MPTPQYPVQKAAGCKCCDHSVAHIRNTNNDEPDKPNPWYVGPLIACAFIGFLVVGTKLAIWAEMEF